MEPSEPPPPYSESTSTGAGAGASNATSQAPSRLQVPHRTDSMIPPADRRSMEDEARPLPSNWVRQFDSKTHHQYFVDTSATPPRSIWHHPYDDEEYLSTLTPAQRQDIKNQIPQHHDLESPVEADHPSAPASSEEHIGGVHKFGRKVKDKLTGSTHEEREAERRQRDEEEARLYRQHQHIRAQMAKAAETGVPQLLGKDRDGKDVYIEPPPQPFVGGGYSGGFGGGGFQGYGPGGYGVNPYSERMYGQPNARYIRPNAPYGRPYGAGYGGGYGIPLLGLGGGLLLGGLLF